MPDFVVEVHRLDRVARHDADARVRPLSEGAQVLDDAVPLVDDVHQETRGLVGAAVLRFRVAVRRVLRRVPLDAVEVRAADLRVNVLVRLPLEHAAHAEQVVLADVRQEHGVDAVEVAREVPEARLARVPAVHQQVEAADAEQC